MFRHAGVYVLFRAGNGAIALASLYVLTRVMNPADYGLYSLGVTSMAVVAALAFQWLNAALARFYHSPEHRADHWILEARKVFAYVAVAVLSVGALVSIAMPRGDVGPLIVLAIACGGIVLGLHAFHSQILNAEGSPVRYGVLGVARSALALLAALTFFWAGQSAAWALSGLVVGSLLAVMVFGSAWRRGAAENGGELRRRLTGFGLPLIGTYLSITALDATDRFMLGYWHGTGAVAGYGAAFDLAQQTIGALLNSLFLAFYPRIVSAWETQREKARESIEPLMRTIVLVAALLCGLFGSLAEDITSLVLGPRVAAEAALVLPLLALAVTLAGLRAFLFDIALHLQKATRLHAVTTGAMAALNVLLNALLIPVQGAMGAAVASALSFAVGLLLSAWFGRQSALFAGFVVHALKAVAAAILMWGAIHALGALDPIASLPTVLRLPLKAVVAMATFAAVAWVLRAHRPPRGRQ